MTKEEFKETCRADKKRNGGGNVLRFIWLLRHCQYCKGVLRPVYLLLLHHMQSRFKLEISWRCTIGKGLYLGHAYCITVNPKAIIGDWCNLHKGVTIGQQNRGRLKGVPVIGNKVWIGVNATIVGRVTIGDDVLIAPNSYVNCDVPSHSVVIGNPCQIHHRENATEGYINNIEEIS